MVQSVGQVLEERGERYGVFMGQAQIAQSLHIVLEQGMQLTGKNRFSFAPDQLEAMNMIVNKIARIYNGDPHYSDSWRDIAGYATLVADRLDNDKIKEQKLIEEMNSERRKAETTIEADRGSDAEPCNCEICRCEQPGVDNRPTGLSELRRLPVTLDVQDGEHSATSKTEPELRD